MDVPPVAELRICSRHSLAVLPSPPSSARTTVLTRSGSPSSIAGWLARARSAHQPLLGCGLVAGRSIPPIPDRLAHLVCRFGRHVVAGSVDDDRGVVREVILQALAVFVAECHVAVSPYDQCRELGE